MENKRNSNPSKKINNNNHFWITLIILSSIAVVIEYAETMLFPAIPDIINNFKIRLPYYLQKNRYKKSYIIFSCHKTEFDCIYIINFLKMKLR